MPFCRKDRLDLAGAGEELCCELELNSKLQVGFFLADGFDQNMSGTMEALPVAGGQDIIVGIAFHRDPQLTSHGYQFQRVLVRKLAGKVFTWDQGMGRLHSRLLGE